METTTYPIITVTTSQRTSYLTDVFCRYADDDKVLIGTLRRNVLGLWSYVNADQHIDFSARTKWEAILGLCRIEGPRHFPDDVVYKFGARRLVPAGFVF